MNAKPLAALSSTLLARKGQAKPAMRPQGFGGFGAAQDDLGWNDMGYDGPRAAVEPTAAVEPPAIVRQQEELVAKFEEPAAVAAPKPRLPKVARAVTGRKAAFTLRLDEERHLRLRLAVAVRRQSAQQLVTEALENLLNTMPELDELAASAKKRPQEK